MVVNWTNEEGSRFQPGMAASGVHGGQFDQARVYNSCDPDGVRFQDALQAIGYQGDQPAGSQAFGAFLELHIEQGPLLEAASEQIGIVTGVQGIRWFDVMLSGFENHAGTTPMHLRHDAMVGAAKLTLAVNELALGYGGRAVGTVGRIAVTPGSPNVIPGNVRFTIDFRSSELTIIDDFEAKIRARATVVADEHGLEIAIQQVNESTPVTFDQRCVQAVRAGTDRFGFACRDMISGAGHDAAHISAVAPTSMIFIPCKDGVSHNEAESATKDDCTAGANVLLHAALSLATTG
jgi:N-carbamoyl-L-amino-acid hydrolase